MFKFYVYGTYLIPCFSNRWLIDNNKFIDANRTGIWGWSYGGYATAMVYLK